MANTPEQQNRSRRFEAAIGLMAPLLDVLLAAGERMSNLVAPPDDDHPAIRPPGEKLELGAMRSPGTGPAVD
jgi:hypothetical protein